MSKMWVKDIITLSIYLTTYEYHLFGAVLDPKKIPQPQEHKNYTYNETQVVSSSCNTVYVTLCTMSFAAIEPL